MTIFSRRSLARLCLARRPAADHRCSPPTSRRKSASTGRPTIRSRWCSRRRACSRRNSPRTASRSAGCRPLGSNKALRIPQRRLDRFRLDRGLGRAGRQDQRQSDQVDLRLFAAGMDRAGHAQGFSKITKIEDLKGKRVAVTRGTDPHIFLVRALLERRPDREGHHAGAAAASATARPR